MIDLKKQRYCNGCQTNKALSEFYQKGRNSADRHDDCKRCQNAYGRSIKAERLRMR